MLNSKQQELSDLMSDISERCYCAGWMSGCEYRLWAAIINPDDKRNYGESEISLNEVHRMKELSDEIGGWIYCSENDYIERFIPMNEWLEIVGSKSFNPYLIET